MTFIWHITTTDIEEKYDNKTELDFNKRLLLKIEIDERIKKDIKKRLYPQNLLFPKNDRIEEICKDLKINSNNDMFFGKIGEFINEWVKIEKMINRFIDPSKKSFGTKMNDFRKKEILENDKILQLDKIRRFRNKLVHTNEIDNLLKIDEYLSILSSIKKELVNKNKEEKHFVQ